LRSGSEIHTSNLFILTRGCLFTSDVLVEVCLSLQYFLEV